MALGLGLGLGLTTGASSFKNYLDLTTLRSNTPFSLVGYNRTTYRVDLAQSIRDGAGVPSGIEVGIQSGVTCGLTDVGALTAGSKLAFNSESNVQSRASSGTGTSSDPYIIRDKDYDGESSTNWAHRFNNGSSTYYVKFVNCRFRDWTDRCIWLDNVGTGGIEFENCEFYNTVANAELITYEQGNLTLTNCLFSGCNSFAGVIASATSTRTLTIRNLLITDDNGTWANNGDVIYASTSNLTIDAHYVEVESGMAASGVEGVFGIAGVADGSTFRGLKMDGGFKHFIHDTNDTAITKSITIEYFDIRNATEECILLTACDNSFIRYGNAEHNTTGAGYRVIYLTSSTTDSSIRVQTTDITNVSVTKQTGSGAANECIESARGKDIRIRYCWVEECTEDAFEHIQMISGCTIEYCVADNCTGQVADFFKQWDEANWQARSDVQYDESVNTYSYCHHIYGDCNNYALIVSGFRGMYFHDVYVDNTATGGTVSVRIEARDGVPSSDIYGAGAMPLQSERGNGSSTDVVELNGDVATYEINFFDSALGDTDYTTITDIERNFITLDRAATQYFELVEPVTVTGDFEIALLAHPNLVGNGMIFSGGTGTDGFELFLNGSGNLSFRYEGSTPSPFVESGAGDFDLYETHYIQVIRTGSDVQFFIDGNLIGTFTLVGDIEIARFGQRVNSSTFVFDGILANIQIWQGGDRRNGTLIHYWKLDETLVDSDVIVDSVGDLGEELVTNGTFDIDLSGWTADPAYYRWSNGMLEDYTSSTPVDASQNISTDVGAVYLIRFDAFDVSGGTPSFKINGSNIKQFATSGTYEVLYTATGVSTNVAFNGNLATYKIDNITIKKITNGTYGTAVNLSELDSQSFQEQNSGTLWLGEDLVTQDVWEDPLSVGNEWSFANNEWSLDGTGALNSLNLLLAADQPDVFRLAGNVVSVTGAGLRATNAAVPESLLDTAGTYTFDIDKVTAVSQLYKRASGVVTGTIDKPYLKEVLNYASDYVSAPTITNENIVYDGFTGIESSFTTDKAVTSFLWVGTQGADAPTDQEIRDGTNALYSVSGLVANDLNGYLNVDEVANGDYSCFLLIEDAFGNVSRSNRYNVTTGQRNFIEFDAAATQRIDLASNVIVGSEFEIEFDIYAPTGSVGNVISGELQNTSTVVVDIVGNDAMRLFAYNDSSFLQNIQSIDISAYRNKWTKVKVKVDSSGVPSFTVGTDTVSVGGAWSLNAGTNIRHFSARAGVAPYGDHYTANVRVWTGGDRNTGTLTHHWVLDEDLVNPVIKDSAAELDAPLTMDFDNWSFASGTTYDHVNQVINIDTTGASGEVVAAVSPFSFFNTQDGYVASYEVVSTTGNLRLNRGGDGLTNEVSNSVEGDRDVLFLSSNTTGPLQIRVLPNTIAQIRTDNFTVQRVISGAYGTSVNMTDADSSGTTYDATNEVFGSDLYPNLLPYSTDLSAALWEPVQSTITPVANGAPDGSTAYELSHSTTSGRLQLNRLADVVRDNETATYSIYVKEGTGSGFLRILIVNSLSSPTNYAAFWVNTSTMAIGVTQSVGNGEYIDGDVVDVGNGWMRVSLTVRISNVSEYGLWMYMTNSNGSTARSTTVTQLLWGSQMEIGTEATDLIETGAEGGFFLPT